MGLDHDRVTGGERAHRDREARPCPPAVTRTSAGAKEPLGGEPAPQRRERPRPAPGPTRPERGRPGRAPRAHVGGGRVEVAAREAHHPRPGSRAGRGCGWRRTAGARPAPPAARRGRRPAARGWRRHERPCAGPDIDQALGRQGNARPVGPSVVPRRTAAAARARRAAASLVADATSSRRCWATDRRLLSSFMEAQSSVTVPRAPAFVRLVPGIGWGAGLQPVASGERASPSSACRRSRSRSGAPGSPGSWRPACRHPGCCPRAGDPRGCRAGVAGFLLLA